MRIYLAGKIAKYDWRHSVVDGLRDSVSVSDDGPMRWRPIERSITVGNRKHDYVGPFFVSCDHGCGHGPGSHGAGLNRGGCVSASGVFGEIVFHHDDAQQHAQVFELCRSAIDSCDLFFAWLYDCTAYGTLVEIGLAHAAGKRVVLGEPPGFTAASELWFAQQCADHIVVAADAKAALEAAVRSSTFLDSQLVVAEKMSAARARCESPIERLFLEAMYDLGKPYHMTEAGDLFSSNWMLFPVRLDASRFVMFCQQVTPNDLPYRLDFALIGGGGDVRIAIELDGHDFHERTKEQAERDKSRDRDLTAAGWRVLRFTGSEVHRDATACAKEALAIVSGVLR